MPLFICTRRFWDIGAFFFGGGDTPRMVVFQLKPLNMGYPQKRNTHTYRWPPNLHTPHLQPLIAGYHFGWALVLIVGDRIHMEEVKSELGLCHATSPGEKPKPVWVPLTQIPMWYLRGP